MDNKYFVLAGKMRNLLEKGSFGKHLLRKHIKYLLNFVNLFNKYLINRDKYCRFPFFGE